jgi:hypothetical protein
MIHIVEDNIGVPVIVSQKVQFSYNNKHNTVLCFVGICCLLLAGYSKMLV